MDTKKRILGKVFISHSSKDKPFVRRLAQRLAKEGYRAWLDEKELLPGHSLAASLSTALQESRVVIVLVSENSLKSKWLAFELNKATERMVEGKCRLVPVLKGDVNPPPELKGLIYADFRKSFARGFKALLDALEEEADKAITGSWRELEAIAEEIFDSHGFSSGGGAYESFDYSFLQIRGLKDPSHPTEDASIVLDVILDYSHRSESLEDSWWEEYHSVQQRYGEVYHLVITERPIAIFQLQNSTRSPRVKWHADKASTFNAPLVVVFADVSSISADTEKRWILNCAKDELRRLGSKLPTR